MLVSSSLPGAHGGSPTAVRLALLLKPFAYDPAAQGRSQQRRCLLEGDRDDVALLIGLRALVVPSHVTDDERI
jgi:hypothetical protein